VFGKICIGWSKIFIIFSWVLGAAKNKNKNVSAGRNSHQYDRVCWSKETGKE